MALNLKPEHELLISGTTAAIVYGIFTLNVPNLADIRADEPGNKNTYKTVNTAMVTSAAVVTAIALLSKSPTVFIVGGAITLLEGWKYHFHNFGASAAEDYRQVG